MLKFSELWALIPSLELVLLEMGHAVEPGAGVAAAQRVLAEQVTLQAAGV